MGVVLRAFLTTWLMATAVTAAAGASPASAQVRLADARPAVELKGQQERTDQALSRREKAARTARAAAKARDAAAAAVARLKQSGQRGPTLEGALQSALAKDEAAARARSAVAAADADVAREGARLLGLYDAVLAERRRAVDAAPAARRKEAVDAYRALVAQRDAVRQALAPVLTSSSLDADEDPVEHASLAVGADDDVETLLEKADLARDLEARLKRRADSVHRRIAELRDEASLEGDVAASVARGQLFDEEDRRLSITRSDLSTGSKAAALPGTQTGTPPRESNGLETDAIDTDTGFSSPVAAVTSTTTTTTVERPLSLPTELLTSTTPSTLSELQALEAKLQKELEALRTRQAALKKAATSR